MYSVNFLHSIEREGRHAGVRLLRDNGLYRRRVAQLREHERWSPEDLRRLSRRLLLRTLRVATRRIPYYRHIDISGDENDVERILVERFPIISKDDLREKPELLYPNRGRTRPWTIVGETGGSTGAPLKLFRSWSSVLWQNAFLKRQWTWAGFKEGMPRASLRGDLVVPVEQTQPPYWYFNRYNNQLFFSVSHLSEETAGAFIAKLREFSPFLMEAYPSTAWELARYLAKRNEFLAIPYIFFGSELAYEHQRQLITERFRTKVMDHYGMGERVAFATECELGSLHVNTDHSYFEIVDAQGRPTDDYGSVVGTTFHNLLMPLVRYQLTDQTRWKRGACACGRNYPMIEKVAGRLEDKIVGSRGNDIGPVLFRALHEVDGILQSQIAQVSKDQLEIRIVPDAKFNPEDQQRIVANVHKLVDRGMLATVKIMDDIPRTQRGKYRPIVNEYVDGTRTA